MYLMNLNLATAKKTLKAHFGYNDFRTGQAKIINAILNKKNTLAILPTGGGKSICFQIPGLMLGGTNLVISPLISLMKDQVDTLKQKNIKADFLNSSLNSAQQQKRLKLLSQGFYQFFYIAPERLVSQQFIKACLTINIPLFIVDEAHCISMWGHDFRPSYQNISKFIDKLSAKPIIAAFTATATKPVIADIKKYLKLQNPAKFIGSFSRDNLHLHIHHCPNFFIKEVILFLLLQKYQNKAGIIYAATRKKTLELYQLIKHYDFSNKYRVNFYHGALDHQSRNKIQENFLSDKLKIIIATNAFGMGVDKSNIRFVIHYQIPGNIENYYQEVGRAGRDRKLSDCHLLYHPADLIIQQQFIKQTPNKLRQKNEQKKLKKMINLVDFPDCYQKRIAQYFSQKNPSNCRMCSYCKPQKLPIKQNFIEYFNLLKYFFEKKLQKFMHEQTLVLLALHQPQTKSEYLKIAGIGYGWLEQYYGELTKFLAHKYKAALASY